MRIDTATRFSSKAQQYAKHRPDYAPGAIQAIVEHTKLTTDSVVADIGSGTGIVSRHFLERGNTVYAVELNPQMRRMAEIRLAQHLDFHSVGGNSEKTMLPDVSIDLITAGQAIRWFDGEPTRREFHRILKPDAWLAILQHRRPDDNLCSEIVRLYAEKYGWTSGTEYANRLQIRPFEWWFTEQENTLQFQFSNPRAYDLDGLIGLELSNSHAPDKSHSAFSDYIQALQDIFEEFQNRDRVTINFTTQLFLGKIC